MKQIYLLLAMLAVSLSMSAQVQNAVQSAQIPDNQAIVLSPRPFAAMEQQRQNAYRGSIFTKAPFFTVDFSDTNEFSVGWTSGVGYHTAAYSHWNRLPDNTAATQNAYRQRLSMITTNAPLFCRIMISGKDLKDGSPGERLYIVIA